MIAPLKAASKAVQANSKGGREMKHKDEAMHQGLTESSVIQGLDAQLAELIETVWACERLWDLALSIDTAFRYGRKHS